MIVTTKDVARAEWIKKSTRPSIDMLRAEELTDRREAVFNSGFWHLDSALWVGPLSTLLADPDRQISFDAAFALGEFGPEASDAIAALLTLLRSEDPPRRDAATYALGKIASSSWAKVLELVDDPIPAISHAAVTAIGRMGSAGNEALPTLIACGVKYAERESSYDEYERCKICDSIGSAISQVERGDAIPQLFALLRSDSSGVRAFAAFAVGQIGSSGQICEPELQKLLADTSVRVRRNAAYAMSRLNLPSDTDTKALESASEDSDRTVKLWAKEALRVIRSEK